MIRVTEDGDDCFNSASSRAWSVSILSCTCARNTSTSAQKTRCHDPNQHTEGLALCHRVTLDSVAHRWVPARTPAVHQCPQGKAVGGPTQAPRVDHRQHDTDKVLRQLCFKETGVDTHLESYVVAEPAPKTGDLRRDVVKRHVNKHVVNNVEVEKSRIIKKIAQRNETGHPGEDQAGDQAHQDSPEYTDKVVDVSVEMQRQFPQIQTMHRKSWRRTPNKWIWVGLPVLRTCIVTLCERHWKRKSTFMRRRS